MNLKAQEEYIFWFKLDWWVTEHVDVCMYSV
jgi:hypothetical protein